MERYFSHLSAAQVDGLACVVCSVSFLEKGGVTSIPVGRTPGDEGTVYACADPCVGLIAAEAERMARELRAATGAESAEPQPEYVDGSTRAGDPVWSVDGHFGHLLRDLRTLVGTESLLATADDTPTVRFLLGITARHAETAMMRARLVLARTEGES